VNRYYQKKYLLDRDKSWWFEKEKEAGDECAMLGEMLRRGKLEVCMFWCGGW